MLRTSACRRRPARAGSPTIDGAAQRGAELTQPAARLRAPPAAAAAARPISTRWWRAWPSCCSARWASTSRSSRLADDLWPAMVDRDPARSRAAQPRHQRARRHARRRPAADRDRATSSLDEDYAGAQRRGRAPATMSCSRSPTPAPACRRRCSTRSSSRSSPPRTSARAPGSASAWSMASSSSRRPHQDLQRAGPRHDVQALPAARRAEAEEPLRPATAEPVPPARARPAGRGRSGGAPTCYGNCAASATR